MHHLTTAIITFIEITRMGCFYKYKSSDQSIDLCVLQDAYIMNYFAYLGIFMCQERRTQRQQNH